MSNPQAVGRMELWAIELSKFSVQYRPRTAIKEWAVTNFIAEFTNMEGLGRKASSMEYPHRWII